MRSCEVCICILHDRVFSAWLLVRVNCVRRGEFSFTGDARSKNFKLVISNYAALYAFCLLPYSCHIHCVAVCKMSVTFKVCTGAWNPWKCLNFKCSVFNVWKVLEFWIKCLKLLEIALVLYWFALLLNNVSSLSKQNENISSRDCSVMIRRSLLTCALWWNRAGD